MPPKKGKDTSDVNYWRSLIESSPLNEPAWSCRVVMIEPAGSDQDRIYMSHFEQYANQEKRFIIKNICKTETIFMVNQLGSETKVKDENNRVFEEAQSYLRDKKDIPPDVLALIVKHLIIKMKEEYNFIQMQKLKVKEGMQRESSTMIDRAEVRGSVFVKPPTPEPPPTPKKDKKKSKGESSPIEAEVDESKKYNTQLRVRGEEWRDKVYVEDFPKDGPQLYIAVTGFSDSYLPICLVKIGVPLVSIVQVRINVGSITIPSGLLRPTKRGQSQSELQTEKSLKYWEELQQLRIAKETSDALKDTAFIVFSPPYWNMKKLSSDPEKIYDELCYLMYDIQDLSRQHVHYLDNIDMIEIPRDESDICCLDYYYRQMNDLPLECVTMYSLLDNMIQAVVKKEGSELFSSSDSSVPTPSNIVIKKYSNEKIEKAETLVSDVFSTLCKSHEMKKTYRITHGEEYETHRDPIVIDYGHLAKYSTFHLGNINVDRIVNNSLYHMPINKLWQNQNPAKGEIEMKISFHVNVLLNCFERKDIETAELVRLLHILACRKLYNNRSSIYKTNKPSATITGYKKTYLKRSLLAEPIARLPSNYKTGSAHSFPAMTNSRCTLEETQDEEASEDLENKHIKFLFECPDISELVSASEILSDGPMNHLIDEYEYFEDFEGVAAFQVLFDAFNKFNCLDYKYCEVTDSFAMMFFNSHDNDGISREDWRCHIPTSLCLQDFFDFVLEEHYDWIKSEEEKYDDEMSFHSQSINKDVFDPYAEKMCIDQTDVETELLMTGSLKHNEFMAKVEESDHMSSFTSTPTTFSTRVPHSKSMTSSTPKNIKQTYVAEKNSEHSEEVNTKPFSGYDLGDRRVEAFGKDTSFFSRDGTKVRTMYYLIIPMNCEWLQLNVIPGGLDNQIWIHKDVNKFAAPQETEISESFRIISKDDVMINIKKRIYTVPIVNFASFVEPSKPNTSKPSSTRVSLQGEPAPMKTETFHSLYITWPNGLVIETVHEENTPIISHVKQSLLSPLPNLKEDARCISLKGEVIIFNSSGTVEVLRPDGSYFNITKCGKKPVYPCTIQDLESQSSSTKRSKDKGGKEKGKPGKALSASSKSTGGDTTKTDEILPIRFELLIDEFEMIETDGQKKRYVDGKLINVEKLLIRTATDYCLGEVFSRRMDGTNILLNSSGTQVVTFYNGTRIITNFFIDEEEVYPEWTDDEIAFFDTFSVRYDDNDDEKLPTNHTNSDKSFANSEMSGVTAKSEEDNLDVKGKRDDGFLLVQLTYTVEHPNFATVIVDDSRSRITIDSPNGNSVTVTYDNEYELKLDPLTTVTFNGTDLDMHYEACRQCKSFTTCNIQICTDDDNSVTCESPTWLKMKDSFSKKIYVDYDGEIATNDEQDSEQQLLKGEDSNVGVSEPAEFPSKAKASEISLSAHGKCRGMYLAKTMKFFIIRRDLSCSELVHRALLEEYKKACRWQPWCSINTYDTFHDHRRLVSVLSPVHLTASEKWLMDSKLCGKPKYMTFKDLKADSGKGYYHWMRPYKRFSPEPKKPDHVIPERLPRAYVLRTLEQQWTDKTRSALSGAKELSSAILRYRRAMEADCDTTLRVPLFDPRTEQMKIRDNALQRLGRRMYEELRRRVWEEVESRARPGVSSERAPHDASTLSEEAEECTEQSFEEEYLRELDDVIPPSESRVKYWRRRAEQLKEEEFYKYLLREGVVPPYFKNILGGAIWWEVDQMVSAAAARAQRGSGACVCTDDNATLTDD